MQSFIIIALTFASVYIELHIFKHMFSISIHRGELINPPLNTLAAHKAAIWIATKWWVALLFSLLLSHFLGYFFGAHGTLALVSALLSTVITNVWYQFYMKSVSKDRRPFHIGHFLIAVLLWPAKRVYEAFN